MRRLVQVEPLAYVFAALLILLLPFRWLAASVTAALIHEICHVLALWILGGRVHRIQLGMTGAVIGTDALDVKAELVCALAGPFGSLGLLSLRKIFPLVAVCGLVQGLFNLLPVYPMDGGRALRCLISLLFPQRAKRFSAIAENCLPGIMAVLLLVILRRFIAAALVIGLLVIPSAVLRKIPCKQRRIKVQ